MTNGLLVGGVTKAHDESCEFVFFWQAIPKLDIERPIIMKLNSYCIFSEPSTSRQAAKNSDGDHMSVLSDLDPSSARFSDGFRSNRGRSFLWGGAFLLLGGGLAWLLISVQKSSDSLIGGIEAKNEVMGIRSEGGGAQLQEKRDGASNPVNPVFSAASVVLPTPAVILGGAPSSPVQESLAKDNLASIPADKKSNRTEKSDQLAPPVSGILPVASDGHHEKKSASDSRDSKQITLKSTKSKTSVTVGNHSLSSEKQATERDVDIITALVK